MEKMGGNRSAASRPFARRAWRHTAALVAAAAEGDRNAWDALVERYGDLVWSVARAHGLDRADAADVSQTTWLRLVQNLRRLREPERVGAWLATTARRESARLRRARLSHVPVADCEGCDHEGDVPGDGDVVDRRAEAAVRSAFAELPARCRLLLRLLLADPAPSYEVVSAVLAMPIGSIGPTRARCLDRLTRSVERRVAEAG